MPRIDEEFDEITEGEEDSKKQKLKTKWAALEALVGDPKRIAIIAADLVQHYERRLAQRDGPSSRLMDQRISRRAHLVRSSQVDPVVLAVARNGRQVDRAGTENHRQAAVRQGSQQRAHTADTGVLAALVGPHQHHLGQLALADVGRGQ